MTNDVNKKRSTPKSRNRKIHRYSERETARFEVLARRELNKQNLVFADSEEQRLFINWKKTKNGAKITSRIEVEDKIRKQLCKEYGIGSSSSGGSSSSNNGYKRKSIGKDKDKTHNPSFSTSTTAMDDDLDAIMDELSSLSSSHTQSDSDEEDHKERTSRRAQALLSSMVLDIKPDDLVFEKPIGEGQEANVVLAKYQNLPVACKFRRESMRRFEFELYVLRELAFSAKLSACRFMNPCIGVLQCKHQMILNNIEGTKSNRGKEDVYLIQRYYENGDLRDYIGRRQGTYLHHLEVLQIALSLFAGLSDAHKLNVGIVDLKLENILVDVVGSAWFTDFGSCIDFGDKQVIELDTAGVKWTQDVAAPEMLMHKQFSRQSDVFMCAGILAEIMTPSLSDEEFAKDILGREKDGSVSFNKEKIHPMYSPFTRMLEKALSNEPLDRPTAHEIHQWLHDMRKLSMDSAREEIEERAVATAKFVIDEQVPE